MAKLLTKGEAMSLVMLVCLILPPIAFSNGVDLPIVQPKQNVWKALAQAANLDSIYLIHSRPGRPFSTCMVGLPVDKWLVPKHTPVKVSQVIMDPVSEWCSWTKLLPVASSEPQELEIFGSTTMELCMRFEISDVTKAKNKTIDVIPNHAFHKNALAWCKYAKTTTKASLQVPAQLPQGIFFICGDRIWHGIPANVKGGPCSIGRISLLSTDLKSLKEQKCKGKRSLEQYSPNCDDEVNTWDKARRIAVAIFSPQTTLGVALTQLDHMGCWLSKHAQSVPLALSDTLKDIDSVRWSTLQNRAAINYLLLAHGHGCEEFEGMCCMNLTNHSESIHENIKKIEESINKLGEITGSWIEDVVGFFDLSPLWKELLKIGFYILVGLLVLMLIVPCIFCVCSGL
ncbi:uncharacterized protein LOC132069998 [Ammospiza nelsoni]|uniref:uncharacterized protein LOC132069998 n=1 Tax=Ammospiza nelsoni TaxID=2857394 RepID=UPI0028698A10|nr:uncharacterized protein LOC132069998 [Ammospiza nelsoni]XP_059322529.1 uncharacterized protein LOC132069998 [Ammospiza nelsoni]